MRRRDLLGLMGYTAAGLSWSRAARTSGKYEAAWESIDQRPMPQWYTDAKFGIFIHWGVYSVPAFAAVNVKGQNPYAEWVLEFADQRNEGQIARRRGSRHLGFSQTPIRCELPLF